MNTRSEVTTAAEPATQLACWRTSNDLSPVEGYLEQGSTVDLNRDHNLPYAIQRCVLCSKLRCLLANMAIARFSILGRHATTYFSKMSHIPMTANAVPLGVPYCVISTVVLVSKYLRGNDDYEHSRNLGLFNP